MKVEMKVNWDSLPAEAQDKPETKALVPIPPRSRTERRLWYIALGREIEAAVNSGHLLSLADAANLCGVSRARVSQLMDCN